MEQGTFFFLNNIKKFEKKRIVEHIYEQKKNDYLLKSMWKWDNTWTKVLESQGNVGPSPRLTVTQREGSSLELNHKPSTTNAC